MSPAGSVLPKRRDSYLVILEQGKRFILLPEFLFKQARPESWTGLFSFGPLFVEGSRLFGSRGAGELKMEDV